MAKIHYLNTAFIDGTDFYSLIDLTTPKTVGGIRNRLNGAKYVFTRVECSDSDNDSVCLIFPDVYCHAEGLRIFREEQKDNVKVIRATSAGVIHANPTHIEDGVGLFGNSLSLQLSVDIDDDRKINDFYKEITKDI